MIAGSMATPETLASITQRLGLDKPLHEQYIEYMVNLSRGDLGKSWFTGNPVSQDLLDRLPATLELITISLCSAILLAIPWGVVTAIKQGGVAERLSFFYGLLAGALPDFWLGLVLIYLLYYRLRLLPAPLGRIGLTVQPPDTVTGFIMIDSILQGNRESFISSIRHLILPVVTLTFVYAGPFIKMTRSTMIEMLESDFIAYAKACGLPFRTILYYAFRNTLPPIVTLIGVVYGYLLGGAVLIETIFSWTGVGQYAVQSILVKDFAAIQGFVLLASTFSIIVYLVVDLVYVFINPRIRL
jgi:peptide/nickel transport system permease protein